MNIYTGIIFPSLNPAKNFQFNSQLPLSKSSAAVGQITCAMIDASNEVRVFLIYNFFWIILGRVWKHCKYKE